MQKFAIPGAIVIAGLIVAGALIYSNKTAAPATRSPEATLSPDTPQELKIGGITATDHIRGNRDADLVLVEFSDLECPYCQAFHGTMQTLMTEYGAKNQLAWIFRNFTIHSLAPREAEVAECAYDAKGNDGFWSFVDSVFATSRTQNNTTPAELDAMAKTAGFDAAALDKCADSGKNTEKVSLETKEAGAAGGHGTPFSVIVLKKPLTDEQKTFLKDTNNVILKQLPAGSEDVLFPSIDEMRVAIGGSFPIGLMEGIINELLK